MCRGAGLGELGIVNWNILLSFLDLDSETIPGPRNRPTKGNFYVIHVAVVRVIDLRWIVAQWRFRIAHKSHQQS